MTKRFLANIVLFNERDAYPKEIMKCFFNYSRFVSSPARREAFLSAIKSFMPYCLRKMGENEFLPLNRDYKPIGCINGVWTKYEDYEFLFLDRDELDLSVLWEQGGGSAYFLYSDSCNPHLKNGFCRYSAILGQSIFRKGRGNFMEFWEGKMTIDKVGWEENMKRFKTDD